MTANTVTLPERLSRETPLDLPAINAALRRGEAQLDWTITREASPEALAALLDALDLAADADALGLDSVPDELADLISDALDRAPRLEPSPPARRTRRTPRQSVTTAARPDTASTAGKEERSGEASSPAVWTALPEPEVANDVIGPPGLPGPVLEPQPLLDPPTPAAVRDELVGLALTELLGPAGGEEEELTDRPRDRYLVGMLAPTKQRFDPEEQDELAEGGADGPDDDAAESKALTMPTLFPSSFGLSCSVDIATTALLVTARWGRYQRVASEHLKTKAGAARLVWKRRPAGGMASVLSLQAGPVAGWAPDPEQPDVHVRGIVRVIEGAWHVTLWLVNSQEEPQRARDAFWLFQPELSVEAADGTPVFRRRPAAQRRSRDDAPGDREDRALAMRYRDHVEFAVGHGVSIHADLAPGDPTSALRLATRVAPLYELPATTSSDARDFPALEALVLDMAVLAHIPDGGFFAALRPLLDAYDGWIIAQVARLEVPGSDLSAYRAAGSETLLQCREVRERVAEGIALIDRDHQAAEAFRFANRAMWQQRVHSLLNEQRQAGGAADPDTVDIPPNRSWRLFQLAFMLLNLPALTDLQHSDRSVDPGARADLLWFPTGGGKTEAYLGLTAYTLAIRRLQGTVAGRSGIDGVAVLMRYTLRLLTLQQFQRAAALICAMEVLRREARDQGDRRWGATPFRLGLWVGNRTTPNTTAAAAEAIQHAHGGAPASGGGSPAQLVSCPWCGSAIDMGRGDITVDRDLGRTILYCGDPQGDCPFSRKGAPREGLPVLVVDEEIYHHLPALLIATVDKFAQMPWKGEVQMLFGQVDGYCPRHGFRSPEIVDSNSHPARNGLPAVRTQPHGPLRPPDLIIQDELHLISGPLGTLVGLYETVIDRLCTWDVGGMQVRPKVIASTATVRRAGEQLKALFLRQAAIFPPPGLDAGDNFFALQRPCSDRFPGRKYLGICAPGVRVKAVLIRVYVAHLAAAQLLYEKYGRHADPWMTLAGYFNAMRELGGMRRLVEDDVRARLTRAAERGLARRPPPVLEELTSRKGATDIPLVLQRLETSFADYAQHRKECAATGKRPTMPVPIDVLLATNMISVGVDVKRLGLMVVAGQPKTTAEYIQATSRVGRTYPGLVCTVLNWARPRDLSHYEQFGHYHGGFYQHVEVMSLTPFAARALDRGLSALLVGDVRLMESTFNANDRAARFDRDNPYVRQAVADIVARAGAVTGQPAVAELVRRELEQRVETWVATAQRVVGGAQLAYNGRNDGVTVGLLRSPEEGDWQPFTCLNSLRDVEPTIDLILDDGPLGDEGQHPFQAGHAPVPVEVD